MSTFTDIISNLLNGLPINPDIDSLLNDYLTHQKLWDDKRFKLVKSYNYSVSTLYKNTALYDKNNRLSNVIYFLPVPKSMNNQIIKYSTMYLNDSNNTILIDKPEIIKSSLQDIYKINYKPNEHNTETLHLNYKIDLDLYKVNLVQVTDKNESIQVEQITEKEKEIYLRPNKKLNFNNELFKQFIMFYRLYPIKFKSSSSGDGNMDEKEESMLCFVYRISLFIYKNIKYKTPYDHSGEPLDAIKYGIGDCAVHANLFSSILRYNGIPCRSLFGRRCLLNKPGERQTHVKNEWYHPMIGWIPNDCSFKDSKPYKLRSFGTDHGDMVTYGIDFISDIPELASILPYACFQTTYYQYFGTKLIKNNHSYHVQKIYK